jgi:hypothetical protein
MAEAVYLLCALASLACAVLLWRGYRRSRARLLLWSSLCFAGLTANNVLLFVDKVMIPDMNLSLWRSSAALAGVLLLIYGLIWDTEG